MLELKYFRPTGSITDLFQRRKMVYITIHMSKKDIQEIKKDPWSAPSIENAYSKYLGNITRLQIIL